MSVDESPQLEAAIADAMPARTVRALVLFGVVVVVVIVARFTPLEAWITDVQAWRSRIDANRLAACGVFITAAALLGAVGLPRLVVAFAAGALFGPVLGLATALIGSLAGAFLMFLYARWASDAWVRRRIEQGGRPLPGLPAHPSAGTVFLVRQIPAPGFILNLALGLTQVKTRHFLAGTLLGHLPAATVATLCGSGLITGSLADSLPPLVAAAGVLLVLGAVGWRVTR